jgi:hypothetical protein
VTNEARYGKDAQLLNIGGEAALLGSEYTIHLAKGWGGGWLPRSMYSLQGRTPVSRTWITHYKIDYSQYSSDKLAFMTLGVSHYWGNFRGLLDLGEYHILSSTPQVSPTWYSGFEGTLSYYFNDCSLSLALGRSLAPGTSPSYSPEKTNSAAIWVVYDLTNHWKLIPDINYYMQQGGPPYFGGGLSLQYSFRK